MPAPGAFVSKFLVEHLYFGVMRFGRSHEVSPPTAPQPHPLGRDEDRGGAAAVGISKSSVAELGRKRSGRGESFSPRPIDCAASLVCRIVHSRG